jgi:hypothetical protein
MDRSGTRKELRQFGFLVGGVFGVIGLWRVAIHSESMWLWVIGSGALLVALGAVLPEVLAPVHKGWMWVGHVLGWINTRILLGVVFYGLVTPIGIVFRLLGKDTMRQAFVKDSPTYRVIKQARPRTHMKYQF